MIERDEHIAEYPVWTTVGAKDGYASGLWTKQGEFTYAILEHSPLHPNTHPCELICRCSTPFRFKALAAGKTSAWHVVDPGEYDAIFTPGEIDRILMEFLL